MLKLTASRSSLAILAGFATLTTGSVAVAGEPGEKPGMEPAAQPMGPAHRQAMAGMMQEMQKCMSQEGDTGESGLEAIRARMSQRMHKCAEGMMPAGTPHHQEGKEGKEDEASDGKAEAGEKHHAPPAGGVVNPKADPGPKNETGH